MTSYVPVDDAARATGVPRRTIARWVRDDRLTYRTRNGRFLVDPLEVDELEELRSRNSGRRLDGTPRKPPGSGTVRRLPPGQHDPGIRYQPENAEGLESATAARCLTATG